MNVSTGFSRQVDCRPDALAVATSSRKLTYWELDQWTSALARALRRRGVGRETTVAICAPRSAELIVGALATLKAGGAYLPLDPAHPSARLELMVTEARAVALLTTTETAALLPSHASIALSLDEGSALATIDAPLTIDDGIATGDELAYIIYTSGSTGTPKGVAVSHNALGNLVAWHQQRFEVAPGDRATQIASPAFDAAVWEIWPYLTAGASIHIPDERVRAVPERLRDWLIDEGITISFLPTPLAEAVLRLEWPNDTALRALLTGGDVLHVRPSPTLSFALVNNYGPTEGAVVATSGAVLSSVSSGPSAPPIGRAIANVDVHIVSDDGTLVSEGDSGELCVGGAGVARGYLRRPSQTAERFVPDSFSGRAGARLYRTGDLARAERRGGSIEFLGRIDQQVKIRGLRVELGEIEAVLARHPGVASAVVQLARLPAGDMLVAYVVSAHDAPVDAESLRAFLAVDLPEYMVPRAFVPLAHLPLTANGKIDRAALPPPSVDDDPSSDEAPETEPLSPLESQLARMVADVLKLETVGVDTNFFTLGGHSLMAAQIITRVQAAFGVELPLRAVFDAPTVIRLAAAIEERLLERIASMSGEDARQMLDAATRR